MPGAPVAPPGPAAPDPGAAWSGAYRRYDLVKELVIATAVILTLTVVAAVVLSSPDVKPVTIAEWARSAPRDFVSTSLAELDHRSGVATYGPPYTSTPGAGQNVGGGPVSLQRLVGVHIPIDTAEDFVLGPLSEFAKSRPALARALARYEHAPTAARTRWTTAYRRALAHASFRNGTIAAPAAPDGPVAAMMQSLLRQAQAGGVDGALLSSGGIFYRSDYTKPLLFLSDSTFFASRAAKQHLLDSQWGMMNETGNYPGQAWLWLYSFWYQVPPFNSSPNADVDIALIMGALTLILALIPWIPGLRRLPRYLGVHRLVWRDYYRSVERPG